MSLSPPRGQGSRLGPCSVHLSFRCSITGVVNDPVPPEASAPRSSAAALPFILGLAGGIGSGKSTVATAFAQLGCQVFDFDHRTTIVLQRPEIAETLVGWWGPEVRRADGSLDRSAIGAIVFKDKQQREQGTERCITEGWSVRRLRREVQQLLGGKKSGGGIDLVPLKSSEDALHDLLARTNDWLNRYKKLWFLAPKAKLARPLSKRTAERLATQLQEAEDALIEQEFIDDNLDRRQLSPLGRARAMRRLLEIEKGRDPGDLNDREEREARDRVGKQLGMCGRNAQRYLNVLRAPLVVQQAFDVGKISLVLAEKVATLPDDVQRMIGNKIQAGRDPKKLILQYVGKPSTRPKHCGTAVTRTIKALKALNQELEGFDLEGFGAPPQPGHLRILHTANKNCVHLIRAFKKNQERAKRARAS